MCLAIFLAIYANKSVYLAFDLIWAAMCLAQLANVLVYWGGVFSCHVTVNVGVYTLRIFIFVPSRLALLCLSWIQLSNSQRWRDKTMNPVRRGGRVQASIPCVFLASSSPNSRHHFHTRCLAVFGRHGDLGTTNKQKHLRQTKYDGARKDKINWYLYISEKVILTGGWEEQRERVRLIVLESWKGKERRGKFKV